MGPHERLFDLVTAHEAVLIVSRTTGGWRVSVLWSDGDGLRELEAAGPTVVDAIDGVLERTHEPIPIRVLP